MSGGSMLMLRHRAFDVGLVRHLRIGVTGGSDDGLGRDQAQAHQIPVDG